MRDSKLRRTPIGKSYGSRTPWPSASQAPRTAARARAARREPRWRGVARTWSASSSSESSIAVVGSQPAQGPRVGADRPCRRGRAGAAVRVLPTPALVEHQRERVDVGLGAGRAALGLLGRHVGEGADDVAGGGQGNVAGEAGDPEVHQLRPRLPLRHLDVLRLDVAVHDAARVGVIESLAEVGADLADLAVAELAGVGEAGQGGALDQLGDEQGVAVLLAHLVEGDDAGVVEPGGGLRLAQHPSAGLPLLLDRLDRDRALEAAVPGLVDDAETPAADAALDQEAVEHEGTDQSLVNFAAASFSPALGSVGKTHPLLHVLTRRPRQASYSPATQPAWRAASWRIPQYAGRAVANARHADQNASRSCCGGAGLRSAAA